MRVLGMSVAALLVGLGVPSAIVGWDQGFAPEAASLGAPFGAERLADTFSWSTRQELLDVAFEVRLDVPQPSDCTFVVSANGAPGSVGPDWVSILSTEDGRAGATLASDGPLQVHAEGAFDTRQVEATRDASAWAVRSEHQRRDLVGAVTWFVAAQHLAAPASDVVSPALSFDFSCDHPFEVARLLRADDVRLFNERSMAQGRSVHVLLVGSLVQQEVVRAVMQSPDAKLLVGQFNNDGTLSLQTPAGRLARSLADADRLHTHADGAGAYEVGLDCLCKGYVWGVLADLVPVESFDASRASGS